MLWEKLSDFGGHLVLKTLYDALYTVTLPGIRDFENTLGMRFIYGHTKMPDDGLRVIDYVHGSTYALLFLGTCE